MTSDNVFSGLYFRKRAKVFVLMTPHSLDQRKEEFSLFFEFVDVFVLVQWVGPNMFF